MVCGTEKLIRKFAKGYERGCGSGACYFAGSDMEKFLLELISEFSGICVDIRKDRGQGVFLSVMSAETRVILYYVHVRNTNARGVDHTPARYSIMIENRDVILEFS